MALSERLAILITANGAQAMSEFQKVGVAAERSLVTTEQKAQRFGASLTRVGAGAVVFGAVVAAGMYQAAQAAGEQQAANLRLENTMANQPALAGASSQAFYDQASALQEVTKFGDEATVSAQSVLGAFGLTQDQILELIPLVQDYAAKSGIDLVTAARNVGKATDGTNTTLKRAGVAFDEAAYSADNFAGTVAALQGYAGGFAEQEGRTLAGQLEILKNRFGEIGEAVGGGAASAFSDLLAPVSAVSDALNGLDPSTQNVIGRLVTFGAVGSIAAGGLLVLAGQAMKLGGVLRALRDSAIATRLSVMVMSTSAGQGLALLAPQITAVAVAAAASYIVLKDYIEAVGEVGPSAEEAAAGTASLITSLSSTGSASEALAIMVDNAVSSGGALADALTMSGTSAAEFADILQNTPSQNYGAAISEMASRVAAAGGSYTDAQAALSDYAALLQDSAKGALEAADASGDLPPRLVEAAIAANSAQGGLTNYLGALDMVSGQNPDAFAGLAQSAASAEQAVDDLEQEIQDYLAGIFDVPSAQRELRQSFAGLAEALATGTWDDAGAALEEVATATAELGVATGDMPAAAALSIQSLRAMRDSGQLSTETFREIKGAILGLPTAATVPTSTPGATVARSQVGQVGDALLGLPPDRKVPISTPGAEGSRQALYQVADAVNRIDRNVDINVKVFVGDAFAKIDEVAAAAEGASRSAPAGSKRQAGPAENVEAVISATVPVVTPGAAPATAPQVIVVGSIDEAMNRAGVRSDHRAVIRRRVLAGAR